MGFTFRNNPLEEVAVIMDSHKTVADISKKLNKMTESKDLDENLCFDLLNRLKELPISLSILQKTGVGRVVNNARKMMKNDELIATSKTLLKSWKKLLSDSVPPKKPTVDVSDADVTTTTNRIAESPVDDHSETNNGTIRELPGNDIKAGEETAKPSEPQSHSFRHLFPSDTDDSVRIKSRELLALSLVCGDNPVTMKEVNLAVEIENIIFADFKNTSTKYRTQIRSRIFNLKDEKNPGLKSNVLSGALSPQRLARMTADEMASEEMKKTRQKMTKDAIDEHQMAVSGGTVTDLLQCSKCKKRNCTYNQVQTRSADEPMTTFVLCNCCGHRWKFN